MTTLVFFTPFLAADEVQRSIDILRATMWEVVYLSAPLLLTGLVIGVIISMFQAATSIQEQTLTFIPKMAAVALVLIWAFPWMMHRLMTFMIRMFDLIVTGLSG